MMIAVQYTLLVLANTWQFRCGQYSSYP